MANERLTDENNRLCVENRDYKLLQKAFGRKQMEDLIEQARQSKQRDKCLGDHER